MLKTLLLSGWFRVQPFLKYVLIVMAIAPVMAASSHATSVNLSSVAIAKDEGITATEAESNKRSDDGGIVVFNTKDLSLDSNPADSPTLTPDQTAINSEMIAVVEPELLHAYVGGISAGNYFQPSEPENGEPLAGVEFAPSSQEETSETSRTMSQADLIAKLKSARGYNDKVKQLGNGQIYLQAKVQPAIRNNQPILDDVPVVESRPQQPNEDPLGSAYPVPMKWIMATQEEVGHRGGGTRYYRSHPVVSPDGRYAVYSRIQLEVKPQMHNTRVSSVLFIEDRQTKRLQVVSSTSRNNDALLPVRVVGDANGDGTIGVLVPISWSQKGDRFLARRFEGIMNTSDASDYAVIWNRHEGETRTVSPVNHKADHDVEKIAILLGWSKSQPDRVLFRTGEMGQEDWPVVSVSDDGSAVRASELDQPVTYREVSQVWAGPQVAYR